MDYGIILALNLLPFLVAWWRNFGFFFSFGNVIISDKFLLNFESKIIQIQEKVSQEGSRGVPGRSQGSQGGSRRLPGSPGRLPATHLGTPGAPLGAIWVPFWVPFWLHFLFKFRSNFLKDFGTHSGSIWIPFWEPKSTTEPLKREKVHLQKSLFYLSKTILFEPGGFPGLPKSLPEAT